MLPEISSGERKGSFIRFNVKKSRHEPIHKNRRPGIRKRRPAGIWG
jgi:hypothetical protein